MNLDARAARHVRGVYRERTRPNRSGALRRVGSEQAHGRAHRGRQVHDARIVADGELTASQDFCSPFDRPQSRGVHDVPAECAHELRNQRLLVRGSSEYDLVGEFGRPQTLGELDKALNGPAPPRGAWAAAQMQGNQDAA